MVCLELDLFFPLVVFNRGIDMGDGLPDLSCGDPFAARRRPSLAPRGVGGRHSLKRRTHAALSSVVIDCIGGVVDLSPHLLARF